MKTSLLFCIAAALLSFYGCVEPQSFIALENRVAAMEMANNRQLTRQREFSDDSALKTEQEQVSLRQDIEKIQDRLSNSQVISKEEYADLKYEIKGIKEDLQRLQGTTEELGHRLQEYGQKDREAIEQRMDQLDNAISKNYEKVIKLEKYMGFEPTVAGAAVKEATSPESPGVNVEQEAYDAAKKLFDEGDKPGARLQFENFINKYPDSDNADNARFWIADSYYAEKWYEKAILEYQKVLETYPDSNKLAAALLKQGYSFAELGEKANARLILKELIKKYPDTNEAKYAQEKLKSLQ